MRIIDMGSADINLQLIKGIYLFNILAFNRHSAFPLDDLFALFSHFNFKRICLKL